MMIYEKEAWVASFFINTIQFRMFVCYTHEDRYIPRY